MLKCYTATEKKRTADEVRSELQDSQMPGKKEPAKRRQKAAKN